MGDDLMQFFAKKAAKSKDKTKKVKVDDVGSVLDRKTKQQEENDQIDEEQERLAQNDEAFFEKRTEDSEWLDYHDANDEEGQDGYGIKYMNLTEQVEEALEEEKITTAEPPKTWGTTAEPKSSDPEMVIQEKVMPYRPRHVQAIKKITIPNINDQEMFPTFEAAEKIEKMKKDDDKKKKNDGFTVVTSDRSEQTYASRSAMNRNITSQDKFLPRQMGSGVSNQASPQTKPNVYIPPWRRNQEANK